MYCLKALSAGFTVALLFASNAFGKSAENYLDLNFRQNRYLGGVQNASQTSNYTFLSGDLNLEAQTPGFNYKLNPMAQGAFEAQDEFYFGVPEAYIEPRKLGPDLGLTIGRRKRAWSKLDEEFNLGIWQPQLRWDYLAPVQQGLTGVFFDWSVGPRTKLTFFTSPLSVPDQGPQFELTNGQFESANRWFVQPQSRVQLFGGTAFSSEAPLYFEIDQPTEEELIMHSSFGLGARHEFEGTPFWVALNYAYKPRNQIHLGIECQNCLNIGSPNTAAEVTAVIHPKIVKHHVATLETGFERADERGWISVTGDIPRESDFPEAYEEAPLNPMVIGGVGFEHYIGALVSKPSWLQYSYMRRWEFERPRDASLFSQDQVESSLDRYPFKEIAALQWKILLMQKNKSRLSMRHRYNYSVPERGGWLSSGLEWNRGVMTLGFGLDILGAEVDANSADAGLFSRYRANDRVFGGLSYVF